MFGAIVDAFMGPIENMRMEEDRNQRQQDQWGQTISAQSFNSAEAAVQREYASTEAGKQRDWTADMSNTAHQRQVKDLRAAGLNPILSAARLGGSPAGSGASASGQAANISASGSPGGTGGNSHSNFAAAQVMEDQKDNLRMDTRRKDAERNLLSQQYNESQERTDYINEQTNTQREATRRERAEADISTADAKGRTLEGNIDDTTYGNIMRYINRSMRAITGGSSAYRNAR